MDNKAILENSYKTNYDSGVRYVEQNNFAAALESFKRALESAIKLVKITYGNEQAGYLAKANSLGDLIERIKDKVKTAAPSKPTGSGNIPAEKSKEKKEAPAAPRKVTVEDALKKLNELEGLHEVKARVSELVSLIKNFNLRKSRGLPVPTVSYHMVFTGNPGTGKTTVARIMADIFCALGIVSSGQLVETDREGLVAQYVGQTAPKTKAKIDEAKGGVLFIDEAYDLVRGGGNDFGQEAINTLLKEMEDHRDEFIVIVAGYKKEMTSFISSNSGLPSRFAEFIDFTDYTGDEMYRIFLAMCGKQKYIVSDDAKPVLKQHFDEMYANRGKEFANARDVRKIYEKTVKKQAKRLEPYGLNVSDEVLRTITSADLDFNVRDSIN